MHLLQHIFGLDDLSGPWYGFWSGVGSDISEVAMIGAAIGLYRRHNCHAKGCWRLGHHRAGQFIVCRKHHPALPNQAPTADEIRQHHLDFGDQ